jgi:NitT/TauT family transport system substrate-binding protein
MRPTPSRRDLLSGIAGLSLVGLGARTATAAPIAGLEVLLAPTGASVVMADLIAGGGLKAVAPDASYRLWRTPDDLRAAIVSGRNKLFTTPSHVPPNLATRGMPIKMLSIIGMGHLSIVTADQSIHGYHDLAGKTVLGFFPHDMPDLVFRALARMEGMDAEKDMKLDYVETAVEAAQLLVAGKYDTAVLSEPAATGAIIMGAKKGRLLRRAIDLPSLWGKHKGREGIPMVSVAVHASLLDEAPDLLTTVGKGLVAARGHVLADRAAAAALAAKTMDMDAGVFVEAIDAFHMAARSAMAVKADLVDFFTTILEMEPKAIGGKLPPDDFYLDYPA